MSSAGLGRSGYSGTPLAQKLGIKTGSRVRVVHAPRGYRTLLEPLPVGVRFVSRADTATHLVHLFAKARSELARALPSLRQTLAPDASVWVSWPKKAAGMPTDLTEDVVRELALPLGFVDVKVCAVNDVWSALKLVVRKELRGATNADRRRTRGR